MKIDVAKYILAFIYMRFLHKYQFQADSQVQNENCPCPSEPIVSTIGITGNLSKSSLLLERGGIWEFAGLWGVIFHMPALLAHIIISSFHRVIYCETQRCNGIRERVCTPARLTSSVRCRGHDPMFQIVSNSLNNQWC